MKKQIFFLLLLLSLGFVVGLPYWIEHDENGIPLKNIWTKLSLSNTTETTFYVYYEGETDKSNGSEVFLVFEEFNNNDFPSSWERYCSPEFEGGGPGYSIFTFEQLDGPREEFYKYPTQFNESIEIRARYKYNSGINYEGAIGIVADETPASARQYSYQIYETDNGDILRLKEFLNGVEVLLDYTTWTGQKKGIYSFIYEKENSKVIGKIYDFYTYSLLRTVDKSGITTNDHFSVFFGTFHGRLRESYFLYYIFAKKHNPSATISITYGEEETGSWTIDGETYTKRRLITISSDTNLIDYQINLDYSYFNNTALLIIIPPSINITEANPSQGYLTRNKTINFTYTVNYTTDTGENASVELYIDNSLVANDTIENGITTLEHLVNVSYGQHNYTIKAYSQADQSVSHQLTRTFEVYFNITPIIPKNNDTLSGNTTIFEIETNNLYNIYCEYYIDGFLLANETYITEGIYNITQSIENGTHTWQTKCYAEDNINYTKQELIIFHQNYITYENQIRIPVYGNVLDKPQRLFFDNKHNLWLLFFLSYNPTDYLYLVRIENNQIKDILSAPLNATDLADYFVLLPNDNTWDLLTFTKDAQKYYYIRVHFNNTNETTYTDLTIHEHNTSEIINWGTTVGDGINYIYPNDYYDPWSYINLPENYTFTNDSFYIFTVKTNYQPSYKSGDMNIYLVKEPNNDTLKLVKNTDDEYYNLLTTAPMPTAPLTNTLDIWIVPFHYLYNTNDGLLAAHIYQVKDKGASWFFKKAMVYPFSEGEKLIATFGRSNPYLFLVFSNATYQDNYNYLIYEATENKFYETERNRSENSFLIFVQNDTFNIFEPERVLSVYYKNGVFNVIDIPYSSYGLYVPYKRGPLTTKDTINNTDNIIQGKTILQSDGVYFIYTNQLYDAKFVTYDEQEEYRKPFKVEIYTNTSTYSITNEIWGYTIPSVLIGGLKNVYITGHNGTKRLYTIGRNSNYLLEAWSLDQDRGFYCTFMIYNQFQIPIPEARVSALRYSILKQSWVVVEQAITDIEGKALLFVEPFTIYKIRVESDNYITMEFDYTPLETPCSINIKLNTNGTIIQPMPDYSQLFDDVSYSIQPEDTFFKQPFNITFTISSAGGKLEWVKMVIIKEYNHTKTTVYNTTLTNPNGGILQYEANETGKYYVYTNFKHQNYDEYSFYQRVYWLGLNIGLTKAMENINAESISGWSWFFVSLIIAILVAGFVAQYTTEGAGLIGILTLWVMTLIYPTGVIVCVGNGPCITTLTGTILLTILVVGGLLATKNL